MDECIRKNYGVALKKPRKERKENNVYATVRIRTNDRTNGASYKELLSIKLAIVAFNNLNISFGGAFRARCKQLLISRLLNDLHHSG